MRIRTSLLALLLMAIQVGSPVFAQESSGEDDDTKVYHLVVEQTNLFTRSRSWADGESPSFAWSKSDKQSEQLTPWPQLEHNQKSLISWRRSNNVFVHEPIFNTALSGEDSLREFLSQFSEFAKESPLPGKIEYFVSQQAYRRTYRVVLQDWKTPSGQGSHGVALFSLGVQEMPHPPKAPLTPEDSLISVDEIPLGLTATEYRKMQSPSSHVRFRPDQETIVYAAGNELRVNKRRIRIGQSVEQLTTVLTPLGYTQENSETSVNFTNGRVLLVAEIEDDLVRKFTLLGNVADLPEVDFKMVTPVMSIHGHRPGCHLQDLLEKAGSPDEDVVTPNGKRVLRWRATQQPRSNIPEIRLEAVVQGDIVERLRGDQLERNDQLILRWSTPMPPWYVRADFPETMTPPEMSRTMKYFQVALQAPDIDRAANTPGIDRVLEFTDHGLSIWEYPNDHRLFQLVVPELPTLGVDLTYP